MYHHTRFFAAAFMAATLHAHAIPAPAATPQLGHSRSAPLEDDLAPVALITAKTVTIHQPPVVDTFYMPTGQIFVHSNLMGYKRTDLVSCDDITHDRDLFANGPQHLKTTYRNEMREAVDILRKTAVVEIDGRDGVVEVGDATRRFIDAYTEVAYRATLLSYFEGAAKCSVASNDLGNRPALVQKSAGQSHQPDTPQIRMGGNTPR